METGEETFFLDNNGVDILLNYARRRDNYLKNFDHLHDSNIKIRVVKVVVGEEV